MKFKNIWTIIVEFFGKTFNLTYLKKFFKNTDDASMMRLLSFIIVCTGCFVVLWQAVKCIEIDWLSAATFVATGLTGKVVQKTMEKPNTVNTTVNQTDTDKTQNNQQPTVNNSDTII